MPPQNKHCKKCHGFCPSGLLDDELCLDCRAENSPEAVEKRRFALALAARSPYWLRVVVHNSWMATREKIERG